MKIKKTVIVIFILSAILSGTGIFLNIHNNSNNKDIDSSFKNEIEKEENDHVFINGDVEVNDSKNVNKKHCLDKICLIDISLSSYNDDYYITGKFKNESNSKIEDKYLNLIFTLKDGKQFKEWYYISSLDANETYYMQMSTKFNLLNVEDYSIENPTEEELKTYIEELNSSEE